MEKVETRIKQAEIMIENLEDKVQDHDRKLSAMSPVVQQVAHRNVVVWIAVVITIINTIILLLIQNK